MRHRDPRKPHCRPNSRGVQAPLGFWDPAGLSSDGDAKEFYRRRVVEIKHGRVSMLACTGYIVQDGLEERSNWHMFIHLHEVLEWSFNTRWRTGALTEMHETPVRTYRGCCGILLRFEMLKGKGMERFATWPRWGWKEMPMGQLCIRSSSDSLATSHLPAKSNSRTFPMAWPQPQRSRQWAGSNTPYFAAFATCGSCTRCLQTHQASFAPVCLVRRPPTMSTASWAFPATWEGRPLLTLRSRRKNLMQKLLTEGWQ